MAKYICLRDDDTNFFTTPEELKFCYGWVLGKYPITLATIPFVHGSESKIMVYDLEKEKFKLLREWEKRATAEELSAFNKLYPIGDNEELVTFLRGLIDYGKIEIAQHGVNHKYDESGPEMVRNKVSFEYIRSGKEYLEKVFNTTIKTFIPPSNTIDLVCSNYVKRLEMNLYSSGGIRYRNKFEKIKSYFYDLHWLRERVSFRLFKKWWPMKRRNKVLYFSSITFNVFNNKNDIIDRLNKSLDVCGFASLGTHYRLLVQNPDYKKDYLEVIEYLSKKDDVVFLTATDYYKLIKEKYYG